MQRFSCLAVLVAAVLGSGLHAQERPEPRYNNKPLAYWLERLQKADTHRDQWDAAEAIKSFGADGGPAVPVLLPMLDDRSADFRYMILYVLRGIGPAAKSAVPALVKALKDGSAREPEGYIQLLGTIGPAAKEAVPVLAEALQNRAFAHAAFNALCQIGPSSKAALPAMGRALRETLATSTPFLIEKLQGVGDSAVPLLIEFLDDVEHYNKWGCASALGSLGPPAKAAVPKLEALLNHNDPRLRLESARALWRIDTHRGVVPVLAKLLRDEDRYYVRLAAEMLGEIGPEARGALAELKAALERDDAASSAARQALHKIEPGGDSKR